MTDQEQYQLFDQFLDNTLSKEAFDAFEQRLSTDDSFKNAFDTYRSANRLGEVYSLLQVQQQLQHDFASGVADKHIRKRKVIKRVGPIALLLIGLAVFPLFIPTSNDETDIESTSVLEPQKSTEQVVIDSLPHKPKHIQKDTTTLQKPHEQSLSEVVFTSPKLPKDSSIEKEKTDPLEPDTVMRKTTTSNHLTHDASPCTGFHPEITTKSSPSCTDEDNGELLITGLQKSTLRFSIDGENYESPKRGRVYFSNLAPGPTYLFITNTSACVDKQELIIASEDCHPTHQNPTAKDYAFRPSFDEAFQFPIANETDATIWIKDSNGHQVAQFHIENGEPTSWDGSEVNFAPGLYVFLIEFENGQTTQGNVRIY